MRHCTITMDTPPLRPHSPHSEHLRLHRHRQRPGRAGAPRSRLRSSDAPSWWWRRARRVGGVSVHTGTIPSKTLRETVLNLTGWRERGFYGRAYRVKKDIAANDLMARLHMTLDHEVDVLEHQFARNGVQTVLRHGAVPRSAPHRGHLGDRRHPHLRGRAHPDRRRHPSVPAGRRAVQRHQRVRQRRDRGDPAAAAQPDGDRRRRDRRGIRHDLQRARCRRVAGRGATDACSTSSTTS